jgi:hypothetical protein
VAKTAGLGVPCDIERVLAKIHSKRECTFSGILSPCLVLSICCHAYFKLKISSKLKAEAGVATNGQHQTRGENSRTRARKKEN